MYCPQCGREHADRVSFCCHCGAALSATAPAAHKKLMRSRTDCKIAGVCGGFAEYLELDATLVRILWAMLVIFGGCGVLGYIVAWIVMPQEPRSQAAVESTSVVVPQPSGNR